VILGRHPPLGKKLIDLVASTCGELVVIPPCDRGRRSVTCLSLVFVLA
jgi:hypothetical protein